MKQKLCINCRHYSCACLTHGGVINARCMHPAFIVPTFGDGTPLEYARLESKKCGPHGKLWEKAQPRQERAGFFARLFGAA